jgi:hypothetical protein
LPREKTEVFTEELTSERGCVFGGAVRLAGHEGVDRGGVFDHDGDFGIVVAKLGAVVQVRAATYHDTVVGDQEFGVDVEFWLRSI